MNIKQSIDHLLAPGTMLDEQVQIIAELNQHQFDAEVLTALAEALLEQCQKVTGISKNAVDLVGTGGDGHDTLNFSTLGAIVAAAAGTPMIKHGSKSATSRCGSFDLLQQMHVPMPEDNQSVKKIFKEFHLAFLFAPFFHPVMKRVVAARAVFAEKGKRTIFNILGPLINPARPSKIVLGVYTPQLIDPMVEALQNLGVESAYVVHGAGLDEFSLTGKSEYACLHRGHIERDTFDSSTLGLEHCDVSELVGGAPEENLMQSEQILAGKLSGPKTDMVCLNAAAAIQVGSDFELSWAESLDQAKNALSSGKAHELLQAMQHYE